MDNRLSWIQDHSRFCGILLGIGFMLTFALTKNTFLAIVVLVLGFLLLWGVDSLVNKLSAAKNKKFMEATESTNRWVYMDGRAVQIPRDPGSQPKKEKNHGRD
jgi:hypothetical protein